MDGKNRKAAALSDVARERLARGFEAERDDLLLRVEGVDVELH